MSLAITAASVENDNNNNNYNENNYNTKNVIDIKKRENNSNTKTQKYREPMFNMEKVKSVINSLHNNSSDDNELADYVSATNLNNKILGPSIEGFTPLDPLKPPESMRQVQKESTSYDSNVPQPIQNDELNLQDLNAAFLNDAQVRDYYRKLAPGYQATKNNNNQSNQSNQFNQFNQPSQNKYSNMLETPATNDVLLNKLNYMINLLEEQVKGENDIVKDWVLYHGNMFGFKNLYIIDNLSRDGTYETLVELKNKYNINIYRLPDYTKKGIYMSALIKKFGNNEFVFPIDIDEFIVYYNKNTNQIACDNETIYNYLKQLPAANCYKMNYINPKNLSQTGYARATIETSYGSYINYDTNAKTFFHSLLFKGVLDHGNHYQTTNYFLSDFCLVHYHCRNLEQIKKKVYNNVLGLKHNPFNLNELKKLSKTNCHGIHHINNQINILENNYYLTVENISSDDINLKPISTKILTICE